MAAHRRALVLALVLAGVALLAWWPRSVEVLRHPYPDGASWFSRDPDGLYHARRVARALDEGLVVAQTDPFLNYPDGARIPWPPYYDLALAVVLKPFAPAEASARRGFLERAVASLPRLFGVACAMLAALAAWRFGVTAALVAGVYVALCRGTINYSVVGTGDHHAWIGMLAALQLLGASHVAGGDVLRSRARSAAWGAALGVVAGLMLGAWVAALLYVVGFQIVLGWWLIRRAREPLPGVATFGFACHVTAALVLLPAVLSSPWRAEFPWMAVNLSWLHLSELALGALVFVPVLVHGSTALAPQTRLARAYPWLVACALATLALLTWLADLAPARGIAEGMDWVSRADLFMDTVQESAPLVGLRAERGVLFLALGYGVLVLPLAWACAAWAAFRRGADELVPWLVAVATLLPQALAQRRFADPLAVPMAIVLGFAASLVIARWSRAWLAALLVALAALAQYPSASSAWRGLAGTGREWVGSRTDFVLGEREALEWIDAHAGEQRDWSVLSHWDRGHVIEWAANAPSVATNFGSYIGADSYRDPSRFFLAERESDALDVLARRRTRFVYVPSALVQVVPSMCRAAAPELQGELLTTRADGAPQLTPRWFTTIGARLLYGGIATDSTQGLRQIGNPLDFVRLVHVTPYFDARFVHPITQQPSPTGYVWERVAGARIELAVEPGAELVVALDIEYPPAGFELAWRARAQADEHGVARLRVPYCTDAANGDGRVTAARWSAGGREGALAISQVAVREGLVLRVQ